MAFFRGMDGSLTVGGVGVAQLEGWSLNASLEELDTTSMGDAWKSVVGGVGSWSGQASAKIDAGVAAQSTLLNSLLAATPLGTTAALVFNVTGSTKKFSGSALLKGIQVPQQMGSIVKVTFDFTGSGALTYSWT